MTNFILGCLVGYIVHANITDIITFVKDMYVKFKESK